jgi:hypothetical protein
MCEALSNMNYRFPQLFQCRKYITNKWQKYSALCFAVLAPFFLKQVDSTLDWTYDSRGRLSLN